MFRLEFLFDDREGLIVRDQSACFVRTRDAGASWSLEAAPFVPSDVFVSEK